MDAIGSENGAQGRNRTTDTAIFSRMLYQLSYPGAQGAKRSSENALLGKGGRIGNPLSAEFA